MQSPLQPSSSTGSARTLGVLGALLLICLAGFAIFYLSVLHRNSTTVITPRGCTSTNLSQGSSGICVKDAQTMVDFIETDGLNECVFTNGMPLAVDGSYNAATAQQVKSVQTWVNCYNHQEGITQTVPTNGTIDKTTWVALCTYGYQYPTQNSASSSPYTKAATTAGNNADCKSLF